MGRRPHRLHGLGRRRRSRQADVSRSADRPHHRQRHPRAAAACATGRHLPEATISHRKAGKNQQDYLTVKLSDVTITAVTQDGTEAEPYTETVSLRFTKVDLLYRARRPDGSFDEGRRFTFDVRTNQAG
ncbi:type VI secretion system tube protein Hcp [Mycolicibacterium farcinogenes]|uniref:Type VI secretion system tube protein Hcp n=1 Tax=Mycolicibacterium farcinogenes TaxID=1802 RepID=A0ACD1FJQ9_MYCFR|nr:type VI secretion system tube protein Hcp [Mycolicibacterium farcinogenes]